MSIEVSPRNVERLRASAQAIGVSVDAYVEQVLNEREELVAIVEKAAARMPSLSQDQAGARVELGFSQSERGEVDDGESFSVGLLAELDELEQKRRAG